MRNFRKMRSRNRLKSANSSCRKMNSFVHGSFIQKENLDRWNLAKFLYYRMDDIVLWLSVPFSNVNSSDRDCRIWQRCNLWSFQSEKQKKGKAFFCVKVWFLSYLMHTSTKMIDAYFWQFLWQASLWTKFLVSYVSRLVLQ